MPLTLSSQIKSYESKDGVLQTTISILLTKLSDELKRSNIEPGDRAAYQFAISDCTLVLGGTDKGKRSTLIKPATRTKPARTVKAASGDDDGRAYSVAQPPA